MTDRDSVRAWVAAYIRAWESNDPTEIGNLFSDEAVYRPTPMSTGWHGRQAIIDGWLGRKDDPGSWQFEWDVFAVDGDAAVVRGVTTYQAPYPTYENIRLIEFDSDGRARSFTEHWMEHKDAGGTTDT